MIAALSPGTSLTVSGLQKRYSGPPEVHALQGVDFSVHEGEVFGILGPNGAGKTTTINVCATITRPTAGDVWIAGVDALEKPAAARRRVGLVSQSNTLDRSLSVSEIIYFHCRYFGFSHASAARRVTALLADLWLQDRAKALPSQLSAGFAKRVQLARAIAHWPRVIVLDEPTAGLDPQTRLAIWDFIRAVKKSRVSVVLSTHHIDEAESLCDRVAIIDRGKVLACGAPQELKRTSGDHVVFRITFASNGPDLEARLRHVPDVIEVASIPGGVSFAVRNREAFFPRLIRLLDGLAVRDINVTEPNLESVFIKLTGRALRN